MEKLHLSSFFLVLALAWAAGGRAAAYDSFRPGAEWLDTEGRPIQAHEGSIIVVDGVYYWYGQNKEKTDGVSPIWHLGINLYSSRDLYNWKYEGVTIRPDPDDPESPLHPHAHLERPHIVFNARTHKFVCWMNVMRDNGRRQPVVTLSADSIFGPWKIERWELKPCGMNMGDADLAVADDGKAYCYFNRIHSELVCADLTDDYTGTTGYYSTHFPKPGPPYVREGVTWFMWEGKHYLVTSGTTGYDPNPSEIAVADTWHGPFRTLGNLHPDDPSRTSYHSQVSDIFKVPGKKDLYIALADRWWPKDMDVTYEETENAYRKWFGLSYDAALYEKYEARTKDRKQCMRDSRYVWLPFVFRDGVPVLVWRDEWRLSEFE